MKLKQWLNKIPFYGLIPPAPRYIDVRGGFEKDYENLRSDYAQVATGLNKQTYKAYEKYVRDKQHTS